MSSSFSTSQKQEKNACEFSEGGKPLKTRDDGGEGNAEIIEAEFDRFQLTRFPSQYIKRSKRTAHEYLSTGAEAV